MVLMITIKIGWYTKVRSPQTYCLFRFCRRNQFRKWNDVCLQIIVVVGNDGQIQSKQKSTFCFSFDDLWLTTTYLLATYKDIVNNVIIQFWKLRLSFVSTTHTHTHTHTHTWYGAVSEVNHTHNLPCVKGINNHDLLRVLLKLKW